MVPIVGMYFTKDFSTMILSLSKEVPCREE